MAVGQAVLSGILDVGAVEAVESRLAAREAGRHAAYAQALRDALELLRLYEAAGTVLEVPAQLAWVWRCSETRAVRQLSAALLLVELPGALELLDTAAMTVEQSAAVVRVLEPLEPPVREAVWARVAARLAADVEQGVQRPPARLSELLRTWAVQADPAAAVERRRRAEAQGNVLLHRRDDGLVDVQLSALSAPLAEAVLSRITAAAVPFSDQDDRSAGRRRLDAAVDLLLGRTGRPAGGALADGPGAGCSGGCGCPLGAPVPCGAQVTVLVPLATAVGVGEVPAQQAGHGPLEPDLLAALLSSGPVLQAYQVDQDGTPVAMVDRVERLERGSPEAVRRALRRLAQAPAGPPQPRHPDDHPPPGGTPLGETPPDESPPDESPPDEGPPDGAVLPAPHRRPRLLAHAHPAGTPGPYRVPVRLQRLLAVRSPRCEWPGCGARAARCDLDHDRAWPHGPTCACNLGPLCRRHHRLKQLGWTKQRTPDGILWTGPTGRQSLSPPQHLDVPRIRPGRPSRTSPLDELSPTEREDALWHADPTDPHFDGLLNDDPGPAAWNRADQRAQERWWARELAALRRQVYTTPHD